MTAVAIRKAAREDSPALARLMNTAGEGIPAYLWSRLAAPGEDPLGIGTQRVARAEGSFSYSHAYVADVHGIVAGMLLGYRLPDPYEAGPPDAVPDVVRPLIELEALVPGAWYINAVACSPAFRGQGIGSRLMRLAETLARAAGADRLALIVAEENAAAKRLYERLGYATVSRRAILPFPGCPHGGDWLLMQRELEDGSAHLDHH